MAKALIEKKAEALKLRKQDKSYSQIKEKISVSKSTLSNWLRNYPLSKEKIRQLQGPNEKRIEKFRETMRLKREARHKSVYLKMKKKLLPLSKKETFLLGLALYWGEGLKASPSQVNFSNSDPSMIRFYLHWLIKNVGVDKGKVRIDLHLYKDMDVKKEMLFWSKITGAPIKQFSRPYIKETTLKSVVYKGFGHGTCTIRYGNVHLKEEVMMGIKAILGKYSNVTW